jgi:hypothetical protein
VAITFPKTWSSGEVLTASDMKNNLDAMRDKAQQLAAADVTTASAWMNTHHVMEPSYNPVNNVTTAVTGAYGGKSNGGFFQNQSYVTRWMSTPAVGTTNAQHVFVPLTCIEVDLTAPCTLFIQWYMNHISPTDGNGTSGTTHFFAYTRDSSIDGFAHKVPEQLNGSGNSAFLDGLSTTNGFQLINAVGSTGTTNLRYGIGVKAQTTAGKCHQMAWSVSIEVFYM